MGEKEIRSFIGSLVELEAQPRQLTQHIGPQHSVILPDACCEDERVDSAQHAYQRADLTNHAICEQCNRFGRARIARCMSAERAHIAASTRNTKQA